MRFPCALNRWAVRVTLLALTTVLLLATATAEAPDAEVGIYSAVVEHVRKTLRDVRSVRIIVAARTEKLTVARLEQLASEGPKDDPPNAIGLAKQDTGFDDLLRASSSVAYLPPTPAWLVTADEPRELRCSGTNWEIERDVFIRFSRPTFVNRKRALVYAYIKDCISFGHDIIVLEKSDASWKVVMAYQIAGAGE